MTLDDALPIKPYYIALLSIPNPYLGYLFGALEKEEVESALAGLTTEVLLHKSGKPALPIYGRERERTLQPNLSGWGRGEKPSAFLFIRDSNVTRGRDETNPPERECRSSRALVVITHCMLINNTLSSGHIACVSSIPLP